MTLVSQLQAAFTRIAEEFNDLRGEVASLDGAPGVLNEVTTIPTTPVDGKALVVADAYGRVRARDDKGADAFRDFRKVNGPELTNWRSALANRELAPANAYLIGDSMSEGYGQSAFSKTWFDIFRDALQREYRNGGEGFNPVSFGAAPTFTHPWTFSGPIDQGDYGWGFGRRAVNLSETTPTPAFLTRNFYGDRIYVLYTTSAATGTMKITIDGVVSTVNTLDPKTQSGRVWDSGPLANGNHTLRIDPNADGNIIVVDGVMVFAQDALVGVHTYNGAHSGYASSAFAGLVGDGSDEYWADMMFQPHTTVASGANGITGNGTTTVTFAGANFTDDDIGEVIYSGADSAFPRGVRIVSRNSSTSVVVNKVVPAGTYTGNLTRSRITNGTRTLGSNIFTAPAGTFNQWDRGKTVAAVGFASSTVIRRVVSDTQVILSNTAGTSAAGSAVIQIKNRQKYPMRPHLLMIQLGFNDMHGWVPKDVYKTRMKAIETTCIEQAQLDLPTMTGIYTDETPSVMLIGLWAPAHMIDNQAHIDVVSGSNIIKDATGYANRFTVADVGKTIVSGGNTPLPAATTITGPNGSWIADPDSPGLYTQVTVSNNALATQNNEDANIMSRQYTDAQWQDFRSAMFELAFDEGWAFYDLYNLGGYIGIYDHRGLTYDLIHPNDQGAQWIADEMSVAVGGVKKLASIAVGLVNNAGEFLIASGPDQVQVRPGRRILAANVVTSASSLAYADITNFLFNIEPNTDYMFAIALLHTAAANTTGASFRFNPSAGMANPAWFNMAAFGISAPNTLLTLGDGTGTAWTDFVVTSTGSNAAVTPALLKVEGGFRSGAVGGVLTAQIASEANAALTLLRGSWAEVL